EQTPLAPLFAILGNTFVIGNAVQPGLELRLAFEVLQAIQDFEHYLLTYVVGVSFVSQISAAHIEQRALITPHQLLIGPSDMKQLVMGTLSQLFIRKLARVIAHGGRMGFSQDASNRQPG